MKTIQVTLDQLQAIIDCAKEVNRLDSSYSKTVEIVVTKETDSYTGGDSINVYLKSSYAECNSKLIY